MIITMIAKSVILRAESGKVITNDALEGPWKTKCVGQANIGLYCEMSEDDYWAKYNALHPAEVVEEGETEGE